MKHNTSDLEPWTEGWDWKVYMNELAFIVKRQNQRLNDREIFAA